MGPEILAEEAAEMVAKEAGVVVVEVAVAVEVEVVVAIMVGEGVRSSGAREGKARWTGRRES